jgi:primosomal replication protein N
MNRLVLSAQLVERGAVRYTPAGLPAIDCKLQHGSTVTEDGQPRQVSVEIKALAIGALSRPLGALALGSTGLFGGFLGMARNGRGLLFHITELTPDPPDSPSGTDCPTTPI